MEAMRRAVIDVGTNSVKLLVAEVRDQRVLPLLERSEQTRLGQGFYETHRLQSGAISQTARAVAGFASLARQWPVNSLHIIGTSAARDALNQDELAAAIQQISGLALDVISGDQEADWVFRGVTTDPKLSGRKLLILDVGGGSTEFILGEGGHHLFRQSFPVGSLRLLERFRPHDPPSPAELAGCRRWLKDYFEADIIPVLKSFLEAKDNPATELVGTGGTATILARMEGRIEEFDRGRIEGMRLSRQQILDEMAHLWSLSLAERKKMAGLPPNRADVILMGAAIYGAVLEHCNFLELYVSTRGLRFGAVLEGGTAP